MAILNIHMLTPEDIGAEDCQYDGAEFNLDLSPDTPAGIRVQLE